eukprot:g952.t1
MLDCCFEDSQAGMELGEVGCAGCSRREPAGDREKLLVSFCFACGAGMCVTGNWDGPGSRGFKCHPKPAEVKNGGNEDKEKKKGAAGEDEGSTGKENDGDQHDREKENKDDGAAKDSTDGKAGGGGRSGKEDGENQSGNAKKQDSYAFLEVKNTRTGRSAGGAAKLLRTEKQPTKSQGFDADGDANSFLHINEQQPVDVEHPKSVEVLVSLDEPPGEKKDITDDHPVISEEQQAEQGNTETADRGKNDKREKLKGGGRGNGASNKKEKKPPASANNNDDKKDEQKGDKKADNEKWREKDKLRAVLIALQILGGVLWLAALAQIWTWQPKCVKTDKKNAAVVGQTQIARAADGGKRKSKEVEDVKAKGARAGTGEVNTNGAEEGQDEDENAADSTSSASSDAEHADELDHADEGEREAE